MRYGRAPQTIAEVLGRGRIWGWVAGEQRVVLTLVAILFNGHLQHQKLKVLRAADDVAKLTRYETVKAVRAR